MVVAIVGRANVGKSSLFNRLIGRRRALVWNQKGVTRDRLIENLELDETLKIELWDLAGWEDPKNYQEFSPSWLKKIDLFVCVLDASESLQNQDHFILRFLRKESKPVLVWLNKADRRDFSSHSAEIYEAIGGFDAIEGSAETGQGVGDLKEWMTTQSVKGAPAQKLTGNIQNEEESEDEEQGNAPTVGQRKLSQASLNSPRSILIFGQPNVGKSSLMNRMSGTTVSLVQDEPGTTRDLVKHCLRFEGEEWEFVDTAGVRKKGKIYRREDPVEIFSTQMVLKALRKADLILLIVAANPKALLQTQEKKLFKLIRESQKPSLIVINKWDQVRDEWKAPAYRREVLHSLGLSEDYWVLFVSAKTGFGVKNLQCSLKKCVEKTKRISTAQLNRWIRDLQAERQPRITKRGKTEGRRRTQTQYLRFNYMLQTHERPMRFQVFTNAPQSVPKTEVKFLENRLRKDFDLGPLPIEIRFRKKN